MSKRKVTSAAPGVKRWVVSIHRGWHRHYPSQQWWVGGNQRWRSDECQWWATRAEADQIAAYARSQHPGSDIRVEVAPAWA